MTRNLALGFFPLVFAVLSMTVSTSAALVAFHSWSKRFGSATSDIGNSVAVDGSGNVYVTGRFTGVVDFGGGPLASAGGTDIFVAKYSASGTHQWSRRFGSTSSDIGSSIALDASGNVLVAGQFDGTVDFGGGNLVGAGSTEIFVAKYDMSGTHLWSQRFGSTGVDLSNEIAVDPSGTVLVTGFFQGTVDFGGGNRVSAGGNDIFVAKYDASGVHQWSQRFGGAGNDVGHSIATDVSGNVLATGEFNGTVDFGGGNLVSAGGSDIFVAKYNANGAHQWSKRFGSASNFEGGTSIAADGAGHALVAGYFLGTVDFGGGSRVSAGDSDIFVAKYNPSGAHQWSQRFGSTGTDRCLSIEVDSPGHVFATGHFDGTVDFGGGALVSAGDPDVFVARYDAGGAHQWSRRFGGAGPGPDICHAIAASAGRDAFLTGQFDGTVDFGGGPLVSAGGADIFVVKYGAAEPLITAITDIGNDQGRQVKIRFDRSDADAQSSPFPVTRYVAFRRDDPAPSATPWERNLMANGWTEVGTVSAFGEETYGIDVPTIGDSTIAQGQYHSAFFIRAATAAPLTFFDSPPDSGYSLDNLAPGAPGGLLYSAGQLSWEESSAQDFDYFTVYGANSDDFASAVVVDYTVSPSMDVSGSPYSFFFVTTTDFSGNEGSAASINAPTDVGGTRSYVLSISAYPNPFNPATTIRYTLPSRGRVTISVYDARGGHVATIVDEEKTAGAYSARWEATDRSHQPVSSGVYFARIGHKGAVQTRKLVLLK